MNIQEAGILIAFKLKEDVKSTERTRFFRELYGCTDKSNYGRYTYKRKGILGAIPHRMLVRAVVIVRKRDAKKLIDFLSNKAEVHARKVVLTGEDWIILQKE